MKKLLALGLIMCVILLLCGCSATEAISSEQQEYIVAALGFDGDKDEIKLTIEAIAVNTDALRDEEENLKISAMGETVTEAYFKALNQITQPLSLGHSAVSVIGSGINAHQLEEILDFHKEQPQINISAMLVFTRSAEQLLNCKPSTSVAVGYDIMSMLEVAVKGEGIDFKNRLYEVSSQRHKSLKVFTLPQISVEEEKFLLDGLVSFKNDEVDRNFTEDEVPLYCIITDSLKRGEINLDTKKIKIKYSDVKYSFSFDDRLNITLNIHLKADGDVKKIKEGAKALLKEGDSFGLGNIIQQKDRKIWEKIKNNYDEYYKNARIKVNIYE